MTEEMGWVEKSKLPWVLLLDRQGQRAAAYTSTHQLVTPQASEQLIAFAEANKKSESPWSEEDHRTGKSTPRELPDWAAPEVRVRCVLLWIRHGHAPDDYWRSIPKK